MADGDYSYAIVIKLISLDRNQRMRIGNENGEQELSFLEKVFFG